MNRLLLIFLFLPLFVRGQVIVTDLGPATLVDGYVTDPTDVKLDDSGNLYICDCANNSRILKESPAYGGIVTVIAGTGPWGYYGDGGLGIHADMNTPGEIAFDRHGNLYIADGGNDRIRKVTPADTITTIAGSGVRGYNGDGIPATAAQFYGPTGVAVDSAGNIYVIDRINYRIRRIDTAGIITTIAGTGVRGFSPDGSRADTAMLSVYTNTIVIDKKGNLVYYDSFRIRRIDTAGIITTIAGTGIVGYSGDGGMATAAEIGGGQISIDNNGNIFMADGTNDIVRKVDTAGIITTVAGNGLAGYSGDGGDPLLAELYIPAGIAVNDSGDIYIGDQGNARVRLITKHPLAVNNAPDARNGISVYPNPCDGAINIYISAPTQEPVTISITNVIGEKIKELLMATNRRTTIAPTVSPGIYFLSATTAQHKYNRKIIVQ